MKIRVADYLAKTFKDQGIRNVFLLSGGGMMHLLDGAAREPSLGLVCHHHEQAAGIAAEGYARASETFGVCYATSGPGATNIVTALAGAWLDSTPVIFLTGQSKVSQTIKKSGFQGLRQFGTFEIDIVEVAKPISKFVWFLDRAEDAPYVLGKAIYLAQSGRPGPVLIDIPLDVQGALIDPENCRAFVPPVGRILPAAEQMEAMLGRWRKACRPLIVAGHGVRVSRTTTHLLDLAKSTGTPVVTTQLAKDILPYDSPWFVGHPGVKGDRAGNLSIQAADFILYLGSSIHVLNTGYEMDQYASAAYKVQVDCDSANFDKEEIHVDLKLTADLDGFFSQILPVSGFIPHQTKAWRDWTQACKKRFPVFSEAHKTEPDRLNIYRVLERLQQVADEQTIVVTDAGSAFYAVGQAWQLKEGQRVITSGGFGAMGWALPAATGAAKACPTRPVYCITGDGSLQVNIHELAVISHHHCNVKIIVLNNNGYQSIKNTQNNYFNGFHAGVDSSSGVWIPSMGDLASTYHLPYYKVCSEVELGEIQGSALRSEGPCLIDIHCNLFQEIIPTVSSRQLPDGRMTSMPIHHMAPFLSEDELRSLMLITSNS